MKAKQTIMKVAKILVVDDHPLMREGIVTQISDEQDLEVCGEAEDVGDAMDLVKSTQPDLAIIDISLKTGDGLDLVADIKKRCPHVKMLILSAHQESLYAERSLAPAPWGI